MTKPLRCPDCLTVNEPGAGACRACGRRLDAHLPLDPSAVTLRRVMGGGIFTAVPPPAGKDHPAKGHEHASGAAQAQIEVAPEDGADAQLASLTDRLVKDAAAAGERFKPYRPTGHARPLSAEAKKAITRSLQEAATAIKEKRLEQAAHEILKAIARDDTDARTWALLGGTYLRLNRPYKAAVGFMRALELDPESQQAGLGLARAFRAAGDLPGCRQVLDQVVASHPHSADSWAERGLALEDLHDLPEAVRSYDMALKVNPDHRAAKERQGALAPLVEREPLPPRAAIAGPEAVASEGVPPPAAAGAEGDEELPDFTDLAALPEKPRAAAAAEAGRPSRVRTHVDGLDEALGGGIPWGHVVLIQGAPGTLKSSLGFAILLQNAVRDGRHGVYVSLEERASSLLKQMGSLGLRLSVDKGSLVVLDPRTAKGILAERKDWIEGFQHALAAIRAERGLDLVVIDSLEALEVLAQFKDHRREMYRLFEWLRDLGVTAFLVTERPDWVIGGHVIQGRWDEDFLADGLIHLRQQIESDRDVRRRLRVVKMRGTGHETSYLDLVLDDGRFKVTRPAR